MSSLHPRLPGARVLDLFAGSGALGIECLSRGAREVVFVEAAGEAARVVEANLGTLGAEPGEARVERTEALGFLKGLSPLAFDLALADPPYGEGYLARLLEAFLRQPFASELWVEHARGEAVPPGLEPTRQRRYGDTLLSTFEAPA
jgi:16S rRNA (guanine966-N2)-methyltransferase